MTMHPPALDASAIAALAIAGWLAVGALVALWFGRTSRAGTRHMDGGAWASLRPDPEPVPPPEPSAPPLAPRQADLDLRNACNLIVELIEHTRLLAAGDPVGLGPALVADARDFVSYCRLRFTPDPLALRVLGPGADDYGRAHGEWAEISAAADELEKAVRR